MTSATIPGERALIEQIRASSSRRNRLVALGIGDDCAILRPPPGSEILVTTDFSLEGRHFRRDWHSSESAGHRCLARGLSDIAAMGGTPIAAFLSLALPLGTPQVWVEGFFRGLHTLADRYRVQLAGGDTAESPTDHILADIILIGSTPAGQALRRSGARPGDLLYVTGTLGGAAAELDRMRAGRVRLVRSGSQARHPQMFPEPRLAVGRSLVRRHLASACIDLSDGLSTDLAHLCRESRTGAAIEQTALPLSPRATLAHALHGGEDYELLFTAPAATRMPRSIAGTRITRIGRVTRSGIHLTTPDGATHSLTQAGFEHLQQK